MNRAVLFLLALALPLGAAAQAFKCPDPATGRVLYTDQPCPGGQTVVPARTPEQIAEDERRAEAARERAREQREEALERERLRLEQEQAAAALRPPPSPAESEACRAARAEASRLAANRTASEEETRTARANAALACGQAAPAEIVVRPTVVRRWDPPRPWGHGSVRPPIVRPPIVRPPVVRPPVVRPPVVQPSPALPGFTQPPQLPSARYWTPRVSPGFQVAPQGSAEP